jgi:NRE family putative nickel resistance protein-like MFS transporter
MGMTATTARSTADGVTYRDVLTDRDFRRLWGVTIFAALGESIAQIALPLLVYAITGSGTMLGIVFAISTLPKIVLSPLAGLLADRVDRRRIVLVCDLARVVAVGSLPFMDTAFQIGLVALIIAVFTALSRPAEQAAIPQVAGDRLLMRAISLTQVSNAAIRVVGPIVGAGLVAILGPGPAFFAQALCFAISSVLVFRLRPLPIDRRAGNPVPVARDLVSGFGVLWRHRVIRAIVMAETVWGGAGTIMAIGLVAYTDVTLNLGDRAESTFALLIGSFAAGMACGGLLASRVEWRLGRSFMLGFGYFAPLMLITLVFVPPLPMTFVALFLFGLSDSLLVVATQQIVVERIPNEERGRFYAVWTAIITAAWSVWYLILGPLTDAIGAPLTFLVVGLAAGLGCPLVLLLTGTLRELLLAEGPSRKRAGVVATQPE